MASSSFCDNCGAGNLSQSIYCNTCGTALHVSDSLASVTVPLLSVMDALPANHLLHERYRVVQEIGEGGFGSVYKAVDTHIADRMVAIKEMRQSGLNTQQVTEDTEAFKQEAFMLARLRHPNLPSIYDYFTEANRWYVVMDFIDGETLEDYLVKGGNGRAPGVPLSPPEVLQIGIQLCNVLDYLHTRQPAIIFRDLKPSNIMRASAGQLFLIDFGIARIFKHGKASDTTALGSPGYAAPEQYGKAQSTPRSDIYALGVTLHELVTGSDPSLSPFVFIPPVIPGYAELRTLIMHMVETDPEKRPASVQYVQQELERIATGRAPGLAELSSGRQSTLPPVMPPPQTSGSYTIPPPYSSQGNMQGMHMSYQPDPQSYSQPPSYRQTPPAKQGISRRTVVGGIVGLIVGGSLLSYFLSDKHQSDFGMDGMHGMDGPNFDPGNNNPSQNGNGLSPNALLGLAYSPNGKFIVTATGSGAVQVLDATTRATQVSYSGHSNGVSCVAWSPDSQRIASASYDQTVQIWNAQTGNLLQTYTGHNGAVLAVAWAPDGKRLVSGGTDNALKVWDAASGKTLDSDYGHSDQVTSVAWSSDGRIASGSADKTVIVYSALPLVTSYTYSGHSDIVQAISWSPNGKRIASASNDQTVQVWDASDGSHAYTYQGHSDQVWAVAWSLNGTYIASGSFDNTMQVWYASDGSPLKTSQANADVVSVSWSPDSTMVIWGDTQGNLGQVQVP